MGTLERDKPESFDKFTDFRLRQMLTGASPYRNETKKSSAVLLLTRQPLLIRQSLDRILAGSLDGRVTCAYQRSAEGNRRSSG